jgi:predicted dehydrogenase
VTDGLLADGVIITAASPSNEIVSSAFALCRKKGRVVLVGDVGLSLNRNDFYAKEIDFRISSSYGPGRYDARYEEQGRDYPIAYVRWTEGRNMEQYLRLIESRQIAVRPLIGGVYPIDEAATAYEALQNGAVAAPIVLLRYPNTQPYGDATHFAMIRSTPPVTKPSAEVVRLAVIGAGSFARDVHLPNLRELEKLYKLQAVAGRHGHACREIAAKYGAAYAATDLQQVWDDRNVDAVLIATRHHLHGSLVLDALRAGKHVLVEKPLALTEAELEQIEAFYLANDGKTSRPLLMTGFNRRFAPLMTEIRRVVENRRHPLMINYRMNAGYLPLDHWVHGPEGGGRNLGEACHIYDLFSYLIDARVEDVQAMAVRPGGRYSHRDNFTATARCDDGSVATLTYTSLGNAGFPKEQMEVFCDGAVLALDDYRRLQMAGHRSWVRENKTPDKGHRAELEAFARSILTGGEWPIPLWHQLQGARLACEVESQLQSRFMPDSADGIAEEPCAE